MKSLEFVCAQLLGNGNDTKAEQPAKLLERVQKTQAKRQKSADKLNKERSEEGKNADWKELKEISEKICAKYFTEKN